MAGPSSSILNGDGKNDPGDPTATTASDGSYSIQVPAAQQTTTNTYKVYEVLQSGWAETYPTAGYDSVTVSGGQTSAANNFGDHYTLNPAVKSITLAATSQTPTNAASVQFVVTFSELVTGADKEVSGVYSDFQLVPVGPSSASVTNVSPSGSTRVYNGSTYSTTFTVTVNTGSGNRTLQLNLQDQGAVVDMSGNGLTPNSFTGPTITIDRSQPTVAIGLANGQSSATNKSPIIFTVTFDKPVTGFGARGVNLANSTVGGTLIATVTPVASSGTYYTTYQVSVSGMSGSGNVVAGVLANVVQDDAGNFNLASPTSATVAFNTQTTATLARASTTFNPTNGKNPKTGAAAPITFVATFSQAVSNFNSTNAAGQLSFTGSTAKGTLVGTISPVAGSNGTQYNIVVSGMTATGNIMLSINAGTVSTATGIPNAASNSSSVFYDIDAPVAVLVNPANGAAISTTTLNKQGYIDIAYSANVGAGLSSATILNTVPKFTLIGTAAKGIKFTLPPTKQAGTDTYRYYFTGTFGAGTVTVSFIANTFQDNAGNWNKAATLSFNVMQGLSVSSPTVTKKTSGTTNATFTVSLSAAATKIVSVRYATANGTGIAGSRLVRRPAAL